MLFGSDKLWEGRIMFKKLALVISLASFGASAETAFDYDGKYDKDQYTNKFAITYTVTDPKDSNKDYTIVGGTLAFREMDNGDQFMYIAHPRGFKDLSYGEGGELLGDKDITDEMLTNSGVTLPACYVDKRGCSKGDKKDAKDFVKNAKTDLADQMNLDNPQGDADDYLVGWGISGATQDDADRALGSEHFTLDIADLGQLKFDPEIKDDKVNSISGSGDSTGVTFKSTMDYNSGLVAGGISEGSTFYNHSPKTLECTGGKDETSSALDCYNVDMTAPENAGLADWQFDFGIEISLGKNVFSDLSSITTADFGYQEHDKLISLDELHASPPKIKCDTAKNVPCDATVVPTGGTTTGDPTSIPEPSTLAIFALGMIGLASRRFKKKS